MQIQILRLFIAGAVFACGCANAQSIPSRAEAEAMPPQQLARLLLGDERAARVVAARIVGFPGFPLIQVLFHEAPESRPDGLCARQTYAVHLSPPPAIWTVSGNERYQSRVEKIREGRWLGVAGASGCNGHNSFADPLGMGEAELASLLRRLVALRSLAASGRPLPFSLKCSEEPVGPAACTDGGRSALATLPLERITDISPIYDTSCIRVVFEVPESSCLPVAVGGIRTIVPAESGKRTIVAWKAEIANAAGHGMTWFVGLAPKDKVEAVELKRTLVHYH